MALYFPAGSWEKAANTCRIVRAEEKDGYTVYVIEVQVPPFKWFVSHRYRQFVELHEKIVKNFSLDKNLLPPKKVFGNKSESFIHERQKALESYLHTIIHQFSLLPQPLAKFLDFHNYEIRGITAALAETFFCEGELIMLKRKMYEFSPLQLHAITERLKLTEPTCYTNNPRQDLAHLVEFITQLKHLKILGSNEYFKESNIIPNLLSYDLTLFKYLDILEIDGCNLNGNLMSVDVLRKRLKSIIVHDTLKELSSLLLCEILHWSPSSLENWPVWHCITYANLSHNSLTRIDPSIKLLSSVIQLDLSYNAIKIIENLETLSDLSSLNLSHNKIDNLDSLHTKLGNIYTLLLSSNKIKVLQGVSKLFSLTKLHLDNNLISSLDEISHLSKLPCIESLNLQNNPVTVNVDYRSQALLLFGSHASQIILDGLKASDKEIDTVSVLQALKDARGDCKQTLTSEYEHGGVKDGAVAKQQPKDALTKSNVTEEGKKCFKQVQSLCEASKFRQQIESLRRIGGNDWLRLLNEMNSLPEGPTKYPCERAVQGNSESSDLQLHTKSAFDKDLGQLSAHHIRTFALSSEMSYPECISLLDNTNENFKYQFISALIKSKAYSESQSEIQKEYAALLPEAKVIWMVLLIYQESSVFEVPICLVMLKSELILLKLIKFSKDISSDSCCDTSLFPDLSFERCILPTDILSITVGPCDAYALLKTKSVEGFENLTFLFNSLDMADLFIECCHVLYKMTPEYMPHPFTNNKIVFQDIHARLPLSNISFENPILFCQRVLVSKVLHKCHYGILHYVFITPSHILLVEERLHIPQVVGLDTTLQPQFHICALVNVHTNIKQIHLKDIDDSEMEPSHSLVENKHLEVLYKWGSWLIIEFESDVLLYLKFFSLKQRNEFLDSFLCARSQR